MREIKFRAWNSAEKRMYFNVGIEPHEGKYCVIDEDGVIYDMYGSAPALMQYTGLKDKNGVEIFEGDIIRRDGSWTSGRLEEIRYDNGHWNYSYDLVEYVEQPDAQWEVVGNLYETPDLISSEELPE